MCATLQGDGCETPKKPEPIAQKETPESVPQPAQEKEGTAMDVFERIRTHRPRLSNSFLKVADFISKHYEEVAFLSITQVANRSGVSESVVVRFAAALGYTGFAEMKRNIKYRVQNNLRMDSRMMAADLSGDSSYQDIFSAAIGCDVANLFSVLKDPYNRAFEQVVAELRAAQRVYVVGSRGLAKLAGVCEFLFDVAGVTCVAINAGDSAEMQKLRALREGYVLLALSLPRYDSRISFALRMAKQQRARTIVISDSALSPDAQAADLCITAATESKHFTNSYCALLAIVNAIVTALGIKHPEQTMHSIKGVEDWMQCYNGQDQMELYTNMQQNRQEEYSYDIHAREKTAL